MPQIKPLATKFATLLILTFISIFQSKGQTLLIDPNGDGGFENGATFFANGWTEVNGNLTNKWFIGNAGGVINGANKAYISSNNGLNNTYDNVATGRVHFYRDITFPANETSITLTFKWQAQGESSYDYLTVCAMPVSQTPMINIPSPAGFATWTNIPGSYVGATVLSSPPNLNLQGTLQTQTIYLPSNFAGTTQRLVFMWSNDNNSGTNPPASLDSISLISRPGTKVFSVANGDFNNTSTWLGGKIPTPGDSVVIDSGHTVTLNGTVSIRVHYLELNGTLNFSPATTNLVVDGDLLVGSSGLLNAFNNTMGKRLTVAGDLTNNGKIDLSKDYAELTLYGTRPQTVGGSGTLNGTGIISGLLFINTAEQPIINWGWQDVIVRNLYINGGWISMGASNSITVGNNAPSPISLYSGGFTDGTIKKWFSTIGSGTNISAGTVPTFGSGSFPFISGSPAKGYLPAYFHRATTALTTAGTMNVTFNNVSGLDTLTTPVTENGYTVSKKTKATWTVTTDSNYAGSIDHVFAIQGEGLYTSVTANTRLLKNDSLIGTQQAGSKLPMAQRVAIPTSAIKGIYTLGIDGAEEPSHTISSGAWNDTTIWSNGIPSCGRPAEISTGDSVWIDGSMGSINTNHLILRGSLAITGSMLTVGCTGNNNTAQIVGKLYVSGGNLNINGSLKIETNATFSHTGGYINVDGNASGALAGSVPSGTPIVSIATSNITLSGGVFTLVDPHTGTVSAANNAVFIYSGVSAINNTRGWTLKFGNGTSTDAGGALATPIGFFMNMGGGKIVIDSLVIDAGLTGINRFVTLTNTSPIGCNQFYITNNGDARTGSSIVYVAKTVVNNGALVTGTLYLGTYLNSSPGTSSYAQTISGTGYFKNNATTPTANFSQLTINNNNAAGVVFANRNTLFSNSNTSTVSNVFTLSKGFVNTLNDTFVLGVSAASAGSLGFSSDSAGFISGSVFSRWWGTAVSGSTITSGQIPTTTNGGYPFTTTPGLGTKVTSRALWLRQTTVSTTGGRITVKYIDSTGMDTASIVDGSYTIDKKSKARWIVSYTDITGTPVYTASLNGAGFYVPSNSNSRIVGATTALSGTHQGGTIFPNAQRAGILLADLNSTWHMGLNNADTAVSTIATGNWDNPNTWSGGSVPSCNDYVVVLPGHTVNVNTANAFARGANIMAGGVLTIADSSLTVGCSLNNASLIVGGTLTVTGGTLNLNGNLSIQTNAFFSQNGGNIHIDGNAAGILANSVPSGTPIVNIPTSTLSLTGGVFTIVDPHAGTTSAATNIAFNYTGSQIFNNTSGWTLKFGNGISTDSGGVLTAPVGFLMNMAGGRIVIDSLVIDAGLSGGNRFVTLNNASTNFACNNFHITGAGDARIGNTVYIAKNIVNNGSLTAAGTLYLGTFLSSVAGVSPYTQTISGTGLFKNNAATPTANFTNLTVNNNNTTGVIFAGQNALRSNTNTGTISGTFTIVKGLVNTLNDTFILGTSATSIGTFNFSNDSGNFVPGSVFSRWWGTAVSGANIISGQIPNTALGAYPFTAISGTKTMNRVLWLRQNTVATTGGRINVKYIDGVGLTPVSINDSSYTIDSISNSKWVLSYTGITGTPTYMASINGSGLFIPSNLNSRIVKTDSALSGIHRGGTALPNAQRSAILLSDLNSTWHIGISNADMVNQTVASGNWNDTLIWSKRTIPTCTDSILIIPGHNVTVSIANANVRSIAILAGGTLTIAGNNLTVGCTNNNASVIVNGTLTVTGGDLNINGSLKIADGATFNQSGGNITLDGNAGGNALNSVPAGTNILDIRSYLINWTGGVFTLVDPHVQSSSSYAFYYNNNAASVDASIAHTFAFGNGISTDPTNNISGFYVNNRGDINATRINFGNVILKGTTNSFENRKVSSLYNLIARGDFTIDYGGILETTNSLKVGGNITVNTGGKLIAQYITLALGSGNGAESPSTISQTISGAGIFLSSSGSSTVASTYDLTVNNTSAGGVIIARPFSILANLNLTNGIIHTTAADSFQVASVSGGSNTAHIDGPCYRKFNASRTATRTFNSTTLVPLGKDGRYLPIWIDPSTTASGSIIMKNEVFANTNTPPSVLSIAPYIWEARVVRDSANFAGLHIQLSDTALTLTDSSRIIQTPTLSGGYNTVAVTNSYTPGATKLVSTLTQIPAVDYNSFVTYGRLTPCLAPSSQPSSFIASNIQGTAFDASFTAASSMPSHYLVVRYPSGAIATAPVNETNYSVGTILGTGTIVSKQTGTIFSQSNLTLNTAYDYYVYAFNNSECHGPIYNTAAPLIATVTTCTSTVPVPTGLVSSNIHINSFTVKWSKSSVPGATYQIDVSTTSNFNSYLSGFQALSAPDTFATITGAAPYTTYFVRVRTIDDTCVSTFSTPLTALTLCGAANIPYTLNFESSLACTKTEKIGSSNSWGVTNNPGYGFTNKTLTYICNNSYDANVWQYTQALNLTAGVQYRISFKYGSNNNTTVQKLSVLYGASPAISEMRDTILILPFINNTSSSTFVTDFTPDTTGIYFIGFNCFSPKSLTSNFYIDDIKVDSALTTCKIPDSIYISGITADSARLNWTNQIPSPTGGYLYYLQLNRHEPYPTNETPATGIIANGDSSLTLSGLAPGKRYNVWMRSVCAADSSTWKAISFTTSCGLVKSFPWIEDFEDAVPPALPACLSVINANHDDDSFITYNSYNKSGSLLTLHTNGSNNDYLVLPPVLLNGKQQLRYAVKSMGSSAPNDYKIVLSTTGKAPSDFTTTIKPLTIVNSYNYMWDSVSLAYYNDTVYIAFLVPPGGLNGYTLEIDNIIVENLPACVAPASLIATILNSTSFGAKWDSAYPTPSNGYQWELRVSGAPGSGPAGLIYDDTTSTEHILINGLIPDSAYTLYVRSDCGGIYSTWRTLQFRSLCAPTNIPYSQNFESVVVPNIVGCDRIENTGSGNNWNTLNSPGSGFTSKTLRYLSSSSTANAWYYTQGLNLTGGVAYRIKFKYGNNSYSYTHKLIVKYDTSASMNMKDTLGIFLNISSTVPKFYTKDFVPSVSGVYYIGFNCFSDPYQSNLFVDDITVELSPCLSPGMITTSGITTNTVTLNWPASLSSPSNGYVWEIRTSGNAGSGATGLVVSGSDSLKTLTSIISTLAPNTSYKACVRSDCGALFSPWDSVTFRTNCVVESTPFVQDFESTVVPAVSFCEKLEGKAFVSVNNPGYAFYNKTLVLYSWTSGTIANGSYFTQGIRLKGGFRYKLKFSSAGSQYFGSVDATLRVRYGNTPSTSGMRDTLLVLVPQMDWKGDYSVEFEPAHSGVYYIGFNCVTIRSNLYLDNIQLDAMNIEPANITVNLHTPDSGYVHWVAPLSPPAQGYEWEIRTSGNGGSGATGLVMSGISNTLSAMLNGLTPNTQYTAFVRSNYDSGYYSSWASTAFNTTCIIKNVPYLQNFDSVVLPGIPNCSKTEILTPGNNWSTDYSGQSGMSGKILKLGYSSVNANAWYYTDGIRLLAGRAYRLTFKYLKPTNPAQKLMVGYGILPTYTSMNDTLATPPPNSYSPQQTFKVDFVPSDTNVYYLGFNAISDPYGDDIIIDDISLQPLPDCIMPDTINIGKILSNAVTFNWAAPIIVPGNGYDWEIRTSGAPGSGSSGLAFSGNTDTLLLNATGLTPSTQYTIYVRSGCGTGSSTWASSISFTTPCAPVTTPYTENFETTPIPLIPVCNTSVYNNQFPSYWVWETGVAANSSNALKLKNYNTSGSYIRDVWYFTRGISLTAGVAYRLRLNLNTNSSYGGERLIIRYGTDANIGAMTNALYNTDLGVGRPSSIVVDFVPTVTEIYYIGFNAASDYSVWQSALTLDDIIVEQLPACVSPVSIKTTQLLQDMASITWLTPIFPPANGYEWELRTSGAANSGITGLIATGIDSLSSLSTTITGLTPSTSYKFYIRSRCGSGFGVWDSLPVTTLCAATNIPYTMNFEGSGYNVNSIACTSTETIGEVNTWSLVNWTGSGFSSMILVYAHSNFTGANSWFYTRGLNLTGGVTYRLIFKGRRGSVAIKYGLAPNSGSMSNLIDNITTPTGTAQVYTRDFTPTASGIYFIGFNCGNYYMNLDDITVQLAACTPPDSIALSSVTSGSATISWAISPSNPSSGYQWEVRTSGNVSSGATGLTASGTTNTLSAVVSGLSIGTQYKIYLRSNCGSSVYSLWDSLTNTAIPVELVSFNGKVENDNAVLDWTTASEINNKGFVVERSTDDDSFMRIGFVKGRGNSSSTLDYTMEDKNAFIKTKSDILYYRLRQQDFDGKEKLSQTIKVAKPKSQYLSKLEAHPNPFSSDVTILFESETQNHYTIEISDIHGRAVSTSNIAVRKGANTITIKDLSILNAGVYIVKLIGPEHHTIKLVKSN